MAIGFCPATWSMLLSAKAISSGTCPRLAIRNAVEFDSLLGSQLGANAIIAIDGWIVTLVARTVFWLRAFSRLYDQRV